MSRILIVDDEPAIGWSLGELLDDRGHARCAQSLAASLGSHPHSLHLTRPSGCGANLSLEDHATILDARHGASRAHEFCDASTVRRACASGHRRDTDLLREHRDAGGHEDVDLVGAHQPDLGIGRDTRRSIDGEQRLSGTHLSGRSPGAVESTPQVEHFLGRPDKG